MDIMKKMSSRFALMASKMPSSAELKKVADEDLKLYNSLRDKDDRNGFLISCLKSFKKKLDAFKGKSDKSYSPEEVRNIQMKMSKVSTSFLSMLGKGLDISFSILLTTCLALGFLALLTLILMNKKLDKFIRLISDMFYETSKMLTRVFTKSLGALLSLSISDCFEEIIKCTENYHTVVKKIISEIRREDLDQPIAVLMAASGLMLVIVSFKYYEILRSF